MLSRDYLTQEFIHLTQKYHPNAGIMLNDCHVKILECYVERSRKQFYYLGIYYPDHLQFAIQEYHNDLKEIAENIGLVEVVCINATRIVRDPVSRLKQDNSRLWLELYWIVTHHPEIF
jgi:hypothetical protein